MSKDLAPSAAQVELMEIDKTVAVDIPIDHNFHRVPGEALARWEASRSEGYRAYRTRWENHPREQIVEAAPIHLDIEATSACNLRCVMCPRTEKLADGSFWKVQRFEIEMYKGLIDEAVAGGLCSLKFNYLGEPLLNPQLDEMIRYAKQVGVVDVMFNTNATLLDEDWSVRLLDSGLDKLFFSFDSPYKEHYERIRVGARYEMALANIRRFKELRDARGVIEPLTRVSMVRMKDNEEEWEAFQALFTPLVDAVAWVDYLDHGRQEGDDRTLVPLGSREKSFCCPQLWQRVFVHPDGVVTPCCIDSDRDLVMGNIHDATLEQIWRGPTYEQMRALHAAGRASEISRCRRCPLASY